MRVSLLLSAVWLLSPAVQAFKERGAAERYFMWLTYIGEEIFTDASKHTLATGCVGTRTGFLGQTGRCNLMEFCDHIWKETPGINGQLDTYTPKERQRWPSAGKMQKGWDFPYMSMKEWIVNVLQADPGVKKGKPIKGHGFTGMIKAEKLIGSTMNWYTMMAQWGDRVDAPYKEYQARLALDKDHPNALTDDQKAQFKKLFETKLPNSIKFASILRLKDRHENWIRPDKKHVSFETKFGHPVVTEMVSNKLPGEDKIPDIEVISKEKTCEALKDTFPGGKSAAEAHWDSTVADIDANDIGFDGQPKAHQRAMDALEASTDKVKSITTPCGS